MTAERSSPRLRWPNGLSGVTAKPSEDMRTITVTVNGDSRLGLNFGPNGKLFPLVESIEPNSLIAKQCPNVQPGMVRRNRLGSFRLLRGSAQRHATVSDLQASRSGSVQIVTEVEGARYPPVKVEKLTAAEAAKVFVAAGRPVTVTLRKHS